MSKDMRKWCVLVAMSALTGCSSVPRWQLRQSQTRTYQVYHQSQQMSSQLADSQLMASQLQARNEELERNLAIANERVHNLAQERSKLHDDYKNLLTGLPENENPLNSSANARFEELSRKYPEFEFDPVTGVSKFNGDLLFSTGSSQVREKGFELLQEFAKIMNDGDASQFNILVVGHTDNQPVVKASTRALHETNWELSAHRATAVVRQLAKFGLDEPRMGVAGYSMYQPAGPNIDEPTRQKNRRVEIFILAPDANVAGRDPVPVH